MAKLSLGAAWGDALAFVKREGALLFPVALLFIALPAALMQYLTPPGLDQWMADPRRPMPPVPVSFVIAAVATPFLALFGTLAIYALSLRSGISVAEALALGLRRLPVLLAAGILVIAGFMALLLAVGLVMAVIGIVLPKGAAAVAAGIVPIAFMGLLFFVGIRLMLLNAVVVERTVGPIDAIRQGWRMTRGQFWRLTLFVMVLVLVSMIVSQAAQLAFGVLAGVVAGPAAMQLVGALAAALVSAVVQVYALVMASRLYRQLSD